MFAPQETTPKETASKETITYTQEKQKHPGRHALPEHLPVSEIIIEPEQDTPGLKKIGEEITETLEYSPASLIKKRTIRPKYAKKEGEGVLIAQLPSRPLEKSIAEASLLAHIPGEQVLWIIYLFTAKYNVSIVILVGNRPPAPFPIG